MPLVDTVLPSSSDTERLWLPAAMPASAAGVLGRTLLIRTFSPSTLMTAPMPPMEAAFRLLPAILARTSTSCTSPPAPADRGCLAVRAERDRPRRVARAERVRRGRLPVQLDQLHPAA